MLGGPPAAVAVPAAATTDARHMVAATAASTDLEFILTPFCEYLGLSAAGAR